MRPARIKGEGLSYHHCVSRIVDRRFIFGDAEKEHFFALMRKVEDFLGLRIGKRPDRPIDCGSITMARSVKL